MPNQTASKVILPNAGIVNIGNAFLDLGSRETLRQAQPEVEIYPVSMYPNWVFSTFGSKIDLLLKKKPYAANCFGLTDKIQADFLVLSGMILTKEFVVRYGREVLNTKNQGIKIIINGGGAGYYTKEEAESFRAFMKTLKPCCFISRDNYSYEKFHDLADRSFNGIDCAFFLGDSFKPAKLTTGDFEAHSFDGSKGPEPASDRQIIRVHHSPLKHLRKKFLKEPNTLISDYPEDYLNVYGNAKMTHSDRVHACVATLVFGGKCQLYSNSPRAQLFEKAGIKVSDITRKPVALDMELLNSLKKKQIEFLSEIINGE